MFCALTEVLWSPRTAHHQRQDTRPEDNERQGHGATRQHLTCSSNLNETLFSQQNISQSVIGLQQIYQFVHTKVRA